jgi:hypothetical protein
MILVRLAPLALREDLRRERQAAARSTSIDAIHPDDAPR